MSRKKEADYIFTPRNHVKFGRRINRGHEIVALVGPEKNKDTLSLQEFAVELYGPGTQCYIILPDGQQKAI